MILKEPASRSVFVRFIITNLLILVIPLMTTSIYYVISCQSIEKAVDSMAESRLEQSVIYVDRNLQNLQTNVDSLIVDYEVNRYLNDPGTFSDMGIYDMRRISERLSSLALGSGFFSRSFIYMQNSDSIIYEGGYSPYNLFYGPLFEVEGFDAASWKTFMEREGDSAMAFLPGYRSSADGKLNLSHFYIRQIGVGSFHRGVLVSTVNAEELGQRLSKLPETYGGWLFIMDGEDNLIASTDLSNGEKLARLYRESQGRPVLDVDGRSYRVYLRYSGQNNWRYIVLMDEKMITSDLIRVRNLAFLLLGLGFLVGVVLSYGLAFSNTKPLTGLFPLLKLPADRKPHVFLGAYTRFEEAVMGLSDSYNQLQSDVVRYASTAQTYFIQNLLRGEYRDRVLFSEERDRFKVVLVSAPYVAIVGHPSLMALAINTQNGSEELTVLLKAANECIHSDDHALRSTSGSLVVILRIHNPAEYKQEVASYIDQLTAHLAGAVQDTVLYGVGKPVEDPFLLSISYSQAEAAYAAISPMQRTPLGFYDEFSSPGQAYLYPLHVEEAIMKAVRSANRELLDSLLQEVRTDNLVNRPLANSEERNLVVALRGTILRLQAEFPQEMPGLDAEIARLDENPALPVALEQVFSILQSMVEVRERGKLSHNKYMAKEIKEYVSTRYRNFDLSLTTIAEKFNISENYLSYFFKEQEGECLSAYIQRKRMAEASALLLANWKMPISTIAANCGYPNVSSFRRAFKRVYGMSPSDYSTKKTMQGGV
ncbi:MAG: helix-turn-helix domain-containing protein [Sphaerochaetaceae bacterium]